jgi:pSer/pThr/pTyr-binding forkhead associated (FHA) protein
VSQNVVILLLRITATVLLYLFFLGVALMVWRDWRAVSTQVERVQRSAARSLGRLVVIQSGGTDLTPGEAFPLSVVTGMGRDPSNTVVIDVPFASAEHALLSLRDDRWWLEDRESRNGTRLNGEPLKAPAIVVTGDEIGIGGVRLRIELEET